MSEIRQRFTGYHAKAVPVIPSRGTRKQQGNRRQPCLNYLLMLSGLDFCYVQPSVFCLEIVKRACENKHRVNTAVDLFCLKQGGKNSDICLKQGQGMRGRAAPPYPGIYRVPLPPGPRFLAIACEAQMYFGCRKYVSASQATMQRLSLSSHLEGRGNNKVTEDNLVLTTFSCLAVWTSVMSNPLFSV